MIHKIRCGQIIGKKYMVLSRTIPVQMFLILKTDHARCTACIRDPQSFAIIKNADLQFIERNYCVVANLLENVT